VVLLSGIVEIALGLGLAFWKKERVTFGTCVILRLVFPGNIAQYLDQKMLLAL
jgi:uncharacterized membrane protein